MAYVYGVCGAGSAPKGAAAALAAEQLAMLDRALRTLDPSAQAEFMVAVLDGTSELSEKVQARNGKPGAMSGSGAAKGAPSVISKAAGAGRRDRVSKKSKNAKARRARCYCGTKLKPKARRCKGCGRVTRAGVRKATAGCGSAFLGKAAAPGLVTKAAARMAAKTAGMVQCVNRGHWSRRGNRCTTCGGPMPGAPVLPLGMVSKSALADTQWSHLENSPDPAMREMYRRAQWGQLEGGQTS